ncbi:MAG TPA: tyrosine--tRNA ligase [Candidatus Saccharimonadales bacterium]|nr:tyrosine--tRNA ligase [Candidatus Saccharimonadales bacterium]
MKLSEDLAWRGLLKDKTFDDTAYLDQPKSFYWGVDAASADSLTVGNLAPLLLAQRLARAGWKAVLLVGGATSLIGDPGGKDTERPLLPREQVAGNISAIKGQVSRLFGDSQFQLVDNYDWFSSLGYLDFLRDVGKHFSMSELIQREYITERMGESGTGISYAEFSYSLIQGYDFWHLYKEFGVNLQMGGSDQWGNMLSGVALIRKKEGAEAQALSMPLVINKATGKKFGKSEEGTIWLDPAKTSETQFRQFWINVDDADVGDYLKFFTFISKEEFGQLMSEHNAHPENRQAQNYLSQKVTELVYGTGAGQAAEQIQKVLTGQTPIDSVDSQLLSALRKEIPVIAGKTSVIEALVSTGLASSNSDARRLLAAGAVYINGQSTQSEQFKPDDFKNGRLLLRRGKAYKDSAVIEQ